MKVLFFLLLFLSSFSSIALTRSGLEGLLKEKGINLTEMEMKGMRVLLGEVTGHIPFSKVQLLVTEDEVILRSEIDSVDFNGPQNLGSVVSVRFNGQYVMKRDVKAAIILQ
jgi:hypothetical protein